MRNDIDEIGDIDDTFGAYQSALRNQVGQISLSFAATVL